MLIPRYQRLDRICLQETDTQNRPFVRVERRHGELRVSGERSFRMVTSPVDRSALEVAWSWQDDRLEVRSDRLGFLPIFYAASPDRILVSPSLPKLISEGAPVELDEAALAAFFQLGFFLGEDTPFRSIRVLPPDGVLYWRSGKLEVSGGFTLQSEVRLTRRAALDGYVSLFQQAIHRSLPHHGRIGVPLSGGRDSRHILLELHRQDCLPQLCVTLEHPSGDWPPRPLEDALVASRLAERLGVRHVILPPPSDRLEAEVRKNILTGFSADEHGWMLPLRDFFHGRRLRVYDGIGGDVLSAGLFLTPRRLRFLEGDCISDLAHDLCSNGYFLTLVRQSARFPRDLAVEQIERELRRHIAAPNPIGSFYFWNRTRREIGQAPFGLFLDKAAISTPYLDPDLQGFLASLPIGLLRDKRFHSDAIARGYPNFADVPYRASGKLHHGDGGRRLARFALQLLLYAAGGSRNTLRLPPLAARIARSFIDAKYRPAVSAFGPVAVYLIQLGRTVELLTSETR